MWFRKETLTFYLCKSSVYWTSPCVSICPRTGERRLLTPVPHPGTRCLTISRTLIFPFKLSNVILRHSSFPHISTFSAFEVFFYKNVLYKFTVIIITALRPCTDMLRRLINCRIIIIIIIIIIRVDEQGYKTYTAVDKYFNSELKRLTSVLCCRRCVNAPHTV